MLRATPGTERCGYSYAFRLHSGSLGPHPHLHFVERTAALPPLGHCLLPHRQRLEAVWRQPGHVLNLKYLLLVYLCVGRIVVLRLVVEKEGCSLPVWHWLVLLEWGRAAGKGGHLVAGDWTELLTRRGRKRTTISTTKDWSKLASAKTCRAH